MKKINVLLLAFLLLSFWANAQQYPFNGLDMNMGNLSRLSNAQSRSISPENFTGEKGKGAMADPVRDKDVRNKANAAGPAKDLGKGWKVNPFIIVKPGETVTIAEIDGPGAIQQIWMTPTGNWRFSILRMYWDDEKEPSVECPVGDFFASAFNEYAQLSSLAVCVNPGSAFNCYWKMPFRKKARITLENINNAEEMRLYYQINYTLTEVPEDEGYFHAQFRRSNPTQGSIHTLVDGIKGKGQYVGTYLAWRVNDNCWWGEGEIKFYMDGDKEYPTICGTGTEDYFCGSYGFGNDIILNKYQTFSGLYTGLYAILGDNEEFYNQQQRFLLYRFHVKDPVYFSKNFKMTMDNLGWTGPRYDDYTSVAFWYQQKPGKLPFELPADAEMVMK